MSVLKKGMAVALAALFTAACSGASEPAGQNQNAAPATTAAKTDPAPSQTATPVAMASNPEGASLYKAQKCIGCHGPDGKGMVKDARDFTDPAWQKQITDDQMISHIKEGAPPKMPAYKDKLNDAEIKALVAHIRSFSK